jgi:hypothetical protein
MTNQEEHRSHWDELAEQLGLGPEKPAPAVRTVAAAPNPPPRHYAEKEQVVRAEVLVDEETSFPRGKRGEPEAPARAPEETSESLPDLDAESGSVDEEAEKSQDSQGRGRRRRRRRSKPDDPRSADESSEAAPAAAATDEDKAPRGRSRRERGRRHPDAEKPPARRQEVVKDQEEAPPSKTPPAEEDDDLDDLSNWQAPSWQELIASLYRPER